MRPGSWREAKLCRPPGRVRWKPSDRLVLAAARAHDAGGGGGGEKGGFRLGFRRISGAWRLRFPTNQRDRASQREDSATALLAKLIAAKSRACRARYISDKFALSDIVDGPAPAAIVATLGWLEKAAGRRFSRFFEPRSMESGVS